MVPFGVSSSVAPLRHVLMQRPGDAFRNAFVDPRHGFRHPVDLASAQAEHDGLAALLRRLDVEVHLVEAGGSGPDFVYQYDPTLIIDQGAIALRSGKSTRRGEEKVQAAWYEKHGIPVVGAIEAPGTVDGGDICWLDAETFCVGRTLRTNQVGIDQLSAMLATPVHVFDVPYDAGPDQCLHLMSVISPVTEKLAVVELPRLPAGLYRACIEREIELVEVPATDVSTLGCNVLTVRPGLVVMLEGNAVTQSRLEERGIEVHAFGGREICLNGSGGPTCLTRPLLRA